MSYLQWSDDYSTGIKQFDEHHKKLIDLTNELFESLKACKGQAVVGKIVREMADYTSYHFAAEEQQLALHKFPALAEHKKEHEAFIAKVNDLLEQHNTGKTNISLAAFTFLQEWLTRHIQGTDQKYGPYLNAKGVK